MNAQFVHSAEALVADLAFEWLSACVRSVVPLQICLRREDLLALIARKRALNVRAMPPTLVHSELNSDVELLAALRTLVMLSGFPGVCHLMNTQVKLSGEALLAAFAFEWLNSTVG